MTVDIIHPLSPAERIQLRDAMKYRWSLRARPEQNVPDELDWEFWVFLAGRGSGKTRAGAERVIKWAMHDYTLIHLVAPTKADVRDTMIEGPAGILACSPPWFRPKWRPSKRKLTWPNGAEALTFSSEIPDRLRGPQCEAMWLDEVAAWKYIEETLDQANLSCRLGKQTKCVITTTPRPIPVIKKLVKGDYGKTIVTHCTTYDNKSNLAPSYFNVIRKRFEGTRRGRQEIEGLILDDNPNALWKREDIEKGRVRRAPILERIIVAVDPGAAEPKTNGKYDPNGEYDSTAAEIGIMVGGYAYDDGGDRHYYVLHDGTVEACTPNIWGSEVVTNHGKWDSDLIVAEKNNGGSMVRFVLDTIEVGLPIELVNATDGKMTRAQPVSSLYEQGRVHHVGSFPELEDQQCEYVPGEKSPDRFDALVWLITKLAEGDINFSVSRI